MSGISTLEAVSERYAAFLDKTRREVAVAAKGIGLIGYVPVPEYVTGSDLNTKTLEIDDEMGLVLLRNGKIDKPIGAVPDMPMGMGC